MIKNELRRFGIVMGLVLACWGGWWLKIGVDASIYFLGLALLLLLTALVYPLVLKPIFTFWTKLGSMLGWVTTRIILMLIFYLIITPIGLWLRLTGKDLLQLKTKQKNISYWQIISNQFEKKQLLKQY